MTDHLPDDVWCLTCGHHHIPTIPVVTYRCAHCGFGQWDVELAANHATDMPSHIVHPVYHRITPTTPSIQAAVERSSLGAPAAQAARATVTDAEAASIVARAQELRDWAPDGHGLAPEAADLIAQGVGGPVHLRLSAPGRHLRTACESGLGGWWTGLASEVTCPICRREADQ